MAGMTMRERMLALVQGRDHDRVPFVQYTNCGGPDEEVWSAIGRENIGLLRWSPTFRYERPNCRVESEEIEINGRRGVRHTLHTPKGSLTEEQYSLREIHGFGQFARRNYFVKKVEDYRILLAALRDTQVMRDTSAWERNVAELGDDGLPHTSLPRTPFQQLWIQWVGLEDLSIHMLEAPEVMEEVMAALFDIQRRTFDIVVDCVRELPIPYVVLGDNITAPTIGRRYFREYCVPSYRDLVARLAETGKDVPVAVHMDGDLKPLWEDIGASGVRMLDSFSPPPDNDTTAADAVGMWPEMRLGLNFPSSVHLADETRIYETARTILEEAGRTGRLQIQISENMPPGAWRRSYPRIVKAIQDFGPIAA